MSKETFLQIINFLNNKNVQFEHLTHEHVHSSEDAAKIRGNSLNQAAKAIVLKVKLKVEKKQDPTTTSAKAHYENNYNENHDENNYNDNHGENNYKNNQNYNHEENNYKIIQVVVPGHRRIDLKSLKTLLNLKSAELASPEEVLEKTGCTIGSVPPFGKLFGLDTYADSSLFENETIFFSAGTHNDSIKIKSKDYLAALKPEVINVSSSSLK